MKRLIQSTLLAGYRGLRRSGLLATPIGKAVASRGYGAYKAWLERDARHLRAWVPPGATVIDVGANVGFFTLKFGRWVGPGGRVIALEPEPANHAALVRAVDKAGLAPRVDVLRAAAAEGPGELLLTLNPDNPADHRLGDSGIAVPALRLDDLLAERHWPAVTLVKIDVQGAESRVLAGAAETLRRLRPGVFIEIDDGALRAAGSSADELIDRLAGHGYGMYALGQGGARALGRGEARARCRQLGYADFLFLHPDATPGHTP